MTWWQAALAHAVKLCVLATLAGIVVRQRHRECWSLPAYLATILIGNTLVSLWPERFFNEQFWLVKQAAYDILKLGVALELSVQTFRLFPRARVMARRLVFGALVLFAGLISVSAEARYKTLFDWQPSVVAGTVAVFACTALVVAHFNLPLPAWPRAVMAGLVSYLLVFTTLLTVLKRHGWEVAGWVASADPFAYFLLMGFWTWASWRRDKPPLEPEVAEHLELKVRHA